MKNMHEKQTTEVKGLSKFSCRTQDDARKSDSQQEARKIGKTPKMKDVDKTCSTSRSGDQSTDDQTGSTNPGRIKNLAGFWATNKEEEKSYRKKRLQVDESSPAAPELEADAPILLTRKAEDTNTERPKDIEVDAGYAKNIASLFQNRSRDASEPKRPFRLEMEGDEERGEVKGEALGDRAGDSVLVAPSSVKLRRRIKDLAGSFSSKSRDDESTAQLPREKIIIDRSTGLICSENSPAEANPNIARAADQKKDDPLIESGRTKGLAERWKQQQIQIQREKELEEIEQGTSTEDGSKKTKPAWLRELEAAKQTESDGVFENEPEVRSDVIRAGDEQPDVISARSTRSARKLWSNIEQEKIKEQEESKIERPISAKVKKTPEAAKNPVTIEENVNKQPCADSQPASAENTTSKLAPDHDDEVKQKEESVTPHPKKHRSKKTQVKKLLSTKEQSIEIEHKAKSSDENDAKDAAQANDTSTKSQTSISDETNTEAEKTNNNSSVDAPIEHTNEKENNTGDDSESISMPCLEKPVRHIRDRKQFDDDDDYFWLEESGLMIYGATLMHVPRGQQHPQMFVND